MGWTCVQRTAFLLPAITLWLAAGALLAFPGKV